MNTRWLLARLSLFLRSCLIFGGRGRHGSSRLAQGWRLLHCQAGWCSGAPPQQSRLWGQPRRPRAGLGLSDFFFSWGVNSEFHLKKISFFTSNEKLPVIFSGATCWWKTVICMKQFYFLIIPFYIINSGQKRVFLLPRSLLCNFSSYAHSANAHQTGRSVFICSMVFLL